MKLSLAEEAAASYILKQAVALPVNIGAALAQPDPLLTICNSCCCPSNVYELLCVYEDERVCLTLNHSFNTALAEVLSHKLNSTTGVRGIFWKPMIQRVRVEM